MGRPFFILITSAFVATALSAGAQTRTFFEERLLDRAPVIVRAKYDADQSCFDVDVAAFKVTHRLRGDVDSRILVLGSTQLSKQFRDLERLLFLKKEPSGCLYRIVDVVDLVGDGDAVEAFVRGFLTLATEVEPARRRAGLKQLVFDGLAMRSEFARRLAVCEIELLAQRVPPWLSIEETGQLAAFAKSLPQDEAGRLGAALTAVEDAFLRDLAGTQKAIPRGEKRDAFVRAAAEYLQDSDVPRRTAVLDRLARKFGAASLPLLFRVLDDEAMMPVAARNLGAMRAKAGAPRLLEKLKAGGPSTAALVEALGLIGDESAVAAVGRRLSSADDFDAAALALARIGGTGANKLLDGVLAQLKRDPRQAPRVETIERVRSKDFLSEDAARRAALLGEYSAE
jgi:hypothetical protein